MVQSIIQPSKICNPMRSIVKFIISAFMLAATVSVGASPAERIVAFTEDNTVIEVVTPLATVAEAVPDTAYIAILSGSMSKGKLPSIYELPYSMRGSAPDWHRMWVNTAVFAGAFTGTLFVLECLPEDATSWNRAALQKDPPQKRWFRNVFKRGPEWDHDNPIFNYVLHPYAGAVYFMSARSCGFNFYQSLLYSACISTVGWEFGIEACMERPSIQDIFVTPLVGSAMGEMFYKLKRHIVANDYRLFGSPVVGNVVAFIIDPVNEVVGLFSGNPARKLHLRERRGEVSSLMPMIGHGTVGFTFACTF